MKGSQEPNSILCDCLSYLAFSVPSCLVSFSASADLFCSIQYSDLPDSVLSLPLVMVSFPTPLLFLELLAFGLSGGLGVSWLL